MASSERWTCDGIPKNGKKYSNLGGAHGFYENDSPFCEDCGLPRESSIPKSQNLVSESDIPKPKQSWPIGNIVIIAVAGIAALLVGGTVVYTLSNRCKPGLEKIDGQCIDPFRQAYQEATQQGNEAIKNANNYQNLEDLETAKLTLTKALEQLDTIPQTALVYPEVVTKLAEYDRKKAEVSHKIASEKAAQQKLQEVKTIAEVAKGQIEIAKTISQLTTAKQKWQEAKNQLNEIGNTPLITNQIQQYRSDYDREIEKIEQQISQIEEENRLRNASRNPNIAPPVIREKIYNPPTVLRPLNKQVNPIKPQNIPNDPCAVKNKPPNCLF